MIGYSLRTSDSYTRSRIAEDKVRVVSAGYSCRGGGSIIARSLLLT
jgi:hypothetical protein